MLKLAKNNSPAYDTYSEGDGSDPISASVVLNNSGGTMATATVTAYLVATTYNYTGITVQPVSEQTGVNWQVSLNGSTWAESVTPAGMDARSGDVATPIYLRAVVANDGSVNPGSFVGCDVQVTATESA